MQITRKNNSPTNVLLTISGSETELSTLKDHVVTHFKSKVKVPGFRNGTAPLKVIEKHIDQQALQSEFLDEAINNFYQRALSQEEVRPASNPKITLKKFVPFTVLEFDASFDIIGPVKLGDYKKIKKQKVSISVDTKEVDDVVASLAKRAAERKEVQEAAALGHEVVIDFSGTNQKGESIKGADGKDYPLELGSNSFIPGFEDNLIGMKAGESKEFTLTFPKDYSVKALANKKVTFNVTIKSVNKIVVPKIDDVFASKAGPFKTIKDLKVDIKKQLTLQKEQDADRSLENDIIQQLVNSSTLELPESLVNDQINRLKTEVRQNLMYRGQTWQEMLEQEGLSEEEFTTQQLKPEAERRVKTGLVLAEVAVVEKLQLEQQELQERLDQLRAQYTDAVMQAELAKPEAEREIASQLLTEKTVKHLVTIATSKN